MSGMHFCFNKATNVWCPHYISKIANIAKFRNFATAFALRVECLSHCRLFLSASCFRVQPEAGSLFPLQSLRVQSSTSSTDPCALPEAPYHTAPVALWPVGELCSVRSLEVRSALARVTSRPSSAGRLGLVLVQGVGPPYLGVKSI